MSLRHLIALSFISLVLATTGCASNPEEYLLQTSRSEAPSARAEQASDSDGSAGEAVSSERLIIRTGEISIAAEAVTEAAEQVTQLTEEMGGQVSNSMAYQSHVSLSVKVPPPRLDDYLDAVAQQGEVQSRSTSSRDITEQMVDIEARLENLYALRDRYRQLLNKADDVTDMLKIEQELSRVQTQIDSIERRRKSLSQQVAMSEVQVTIQALPEEEPTRIYGPLGYLGKGLYWAVKKLFIIR